MFPIGQSGLAPGQSAISSASIGGLPALSLGCCPQPQTSRDGGYCEATLAPQNSSWRDVRSRSYDLAGNGPFPARSRFQVPGARRHRRSRRRDRRPRRRIPCDERSATARSTVAAGSRPGPAARRRGRRVPCPARPRRLKPPLLRPNTRPPPRSARRRSPTGPSQCARARARDARSVSRERAGHLEPARRDAALVRRLLPSPRLAGGRDRGRPGAPPRAGRSHQGNPLRPTRSAVAPRRCRGA